MYFNKTCVKFLQNFYFQFFFITSVILYTTGVIENFAAYFLSLQAGRFDIGCGLPE